MAAQPSRNLDSSPSGGSTQPTLLTPGLLPPTSGLGAELETSRDFIKGAGMKRDSSNVSVCLPGGHLPGHSASDLTF